MASHDKMTRDINNRVKKAFGPRARNTGKLLLHTAGDFVTASFPAPVAMMQVNNDLLRDAAKFLRNPTDQLNKQIDRATGSDSFKAIKKFAQNALEDLKSGNLYDPERDRTEFGDMFNDDLMDFGGFDLTNYDENGDYIENTNSNGDSLNMDVEIAKVQDKAANARTEATIDAIGQSTDAIVQTENSNAQVMLKMLMKQHQQNMQVNQNMMAGQQAIFELMNRSVNAGAAMIAEAHNELMEKLDETNGLLRTIVANTTPPQKDEPRYKTKQSPFGFNGELDIKQFFKQGIKNVDDKFGLSSMMSMATMGMGFKDLMEAYQSNPWELIASTIFGGLVPKGTKKQMERTNNIMSNFLPAISSKLTQRGHNFTSGKSTSTLDAVLSLFFPETRSNSAITTAIGDYMKPAQFTAKTARAIEEVIPMWLSRIDSHIAGTPLMVYNYSTGKLENAGMTVGKYEYDSKNVYKGMGGAANEAIARANKYKFTGADGREDKKAKDDFLDFVYGYFQHQGENSGFINPYASKEKFLNGYTTGDANKDSTYMTLLTSVMRAMGSEDPNKLFELANGVQRGRASRDRKTFYNNQELRNSGQIAAWSFMDPELTKAIGETALGARGELELSDIEDLSKALKVNTLKGGGVNASNVLLNDILSTLRSGIITYSYNFGKFPMDQFSKLPDYVQSQMSKYRSNHPNGPLPGPGGGPGAGSSGGSSGGGGNPPAGDIIDTADPFRVEIDKLFESDYAGNGTVSWYDAQKGIDWEHAQKEGTRPRTEDEQLRERYNNIGKGFRDRLKSTRDSLLRNSESSGSKLVTILKKIRNEPFEIFNDAMGYADAYMTKMMFGSDVTDDISHNGEPYLFQTISNAMKGMYTKTFDFFKYKFTEKIIDPVDKFLFDKENGIFPKIGKGVSNVLHLDDLKDKAKNKFNETKEKILGKKGEDGQYSGGRVSDFMNRTVGAKKGVGETVMDAVKHALYGNFAGTHGKGTVVDEYGVSGEGFVMGTQSHTEYGGIIGKIRQGFDSVSEALFGKGEGGKDKRSEQMRKIFGQELKEAAPNMTIGAGLGLIGSMFLPGGPVLGAVLGAGAGFMKSSSRMQKYLFGEFSDEDEEYEDTDAYGNPVMKTRKKQTKKGVIDRKITDAFKKYTPSVAKGAGIGILGSMFLPGGPVLGAILGGAAGFTKANDNLRQLFFGDSEDPDSGLISKNFRDKVMGVVKKVAPAALGGMAIGSMTAGLIGKIGIMPGLMLGPGGPILGGIGAITAAMNADKIKNFFFGEEVEGEDGKKHREGGLFGKSHEWLNKKAIKPLGEKINEVGDHIGEWFRKDVVGPLSRTFDPIKKAMKDAGEGIKNSLLHVGDSIATGVVNALGLNAGDSFGSFWKDKVKPKLESATNKLFSGIGKVIGGVISAPFKAMELLVTGHIGSEPQPAMAGATAGGGGATMPMRNVPLLPAPGQTSANGSVSGNNAGAATSDMQNALAKKKTGIFARFYKKIDQKAERSRDPAQVYDEAIANAQTPEELEAAQAAAQLNANNGIISMTRSDSTNNEKKESLLEKFIGAGGLKGIAGKLLAIPAVAKILSFLGKGGGALTDGITLGGLAKGALPTAVAGVGAARAFKKGEVLTGVSDTMRGGVLAGLGLTKAARGAAEILTAPEGAAMKTTAGAKLLAKIYEGVQKLCKSKVVAKACAKFPGFEKVVTGALKNFDNVILKLGSESAKQFLKKCNIAIIVATAVADFGTGMYQACNYFNVRADDVTLGMRLAAGFAKAISGIAFGLIPKEWLASTLFKFFANDEKEADLADKQANLQAELDQYNTSNGTNLTIDEYAEQINGKRNLKGIVQGIGGKIKAGFNTMKEKFEESKAFDFLSSIGTNSANLAKIASSGDIKAWFNYAPMQDVDEDAPLHGVIRVINTSAKLLTFPQVATSWLGHKIWDGFKAIGAGIKGTVTSINSTYQTQAELARQGKIGEMWQNEADVQEDGVGFIVKAMGFANKVVMTPMAGMSWVGHKIGDFFSNIFGKLKTATSGLQSTAEDMIRAVYAGDFEALNNAKFEGDESNGLSKIFAGVGNAMKYLLYIPTALHWIGNKIANVFNTVVDGVKGAFNKAKDWVVDKFEGSWLDTLVNGNPDYQPETGTGMKRYSQTDPRWNRMGNNIADVGCGPTVASMVATAYGKSGNPVEANNKSYAMGMRAADGGTNPAFFGQYAASKGFGMGVGPNSAGMVARNSASGRPVVLMGKGGAFGNNMHYLVTDGMSGKNVNVVDPLTGSSSATNLKNLMGNVSSTVYSYGKGGTQTDTHTSYRHEQDTAGAQQALVNKMSGIEGKLKYSLDGDKQDPDMGVASCASTVGWAYRKVFGDQDNFTSNRMSAGATPQAKDSRFSTIWTNKGNGGININMLQPGDVMYYNWKQTADNGQMAHAEMYAGNGYDYSHGGGESGTEMGPVKKQLNDYRKAHLMRVRRYNPFIDGSVKTYDDSVVNVDSYEGDLDAANDEENFNNLSLFGKIEAIISGQFKKNSKSLYTQITDGMSGSTDENSPDSYLSDHVTDTASIAGTDNGHKIWNYLMSKGLTKYQAAGIMGNLYKESTLKSKSVEKGKGYTDDSYTTLADSGSYDSKFANDGIGYGLAGFTHSTLKAPLLANAKSNGKSISDLGLQLDLLWKTLETTNGTLDKVKSSTTIDDATLAMLDNYERCAGYKTDAERNQRIGFANQMLQTYGTGRGPSQNLLSLNNSIHGINSTITRMRTEGAADATSAAVASKISRAVDRITESGKGATSTDGRILELLTTTLGEIVGVLNKIESHTAQLDGTADGDSSNSTKTVRADNYQANSKTYDKTDLYGDHGSKIVDNLTRV